MAVPDLATCSYTGYSRDMGTAVRITLWAPRWISLPNPKFTERQHWPYVAELAPRQAYFKAPAVVFNAAYRAQLDANAEQIEEKLTWIQEAEGGPLVLLCFEKQVRGPDDCHRRLFAQWWQERTGIAVPELDGRR